MRISTRLKTAALVPTLMAAVTGVGLYIARASVETWEQRQTAAFAIRDMVGELSNLASSYASDPQERSRRQFLHMHQQATDLISVSVFDDTCQQRDLDGIARSTEVLKTLFLKMVSNNKRHGAGQSDALFAEAQQRLVGQILIRTRDAIYHASELVNRIDRSIHARQRSVHVWMLSLMLATAAALTVLLLGLMKRITRALKKLQEGTEAFGSGDMTFRIGMSGGDELGRLSQAFDRMAGTLQTTTVSRDELTAEVEQRSKVQDELQRQQEWLQVTLTSIGDAVLATDIDGRITFLNPVAATLTGWLHDQALGRRVHEVFRIVNEQTHEPCDDIVESVLREKRVVALANHTMLVTRDGRVVPIEDSAAPIRDSEDRVAGAVLVFHDVTEKRRAQQALRKSEKQYRELFSSMSEGFALNEIITDEGGQPCDYRFLDVNPAFERLTGLKRQDILGKRVLEVMPNNDPVWLRAFGKVALTGEPANLEIFSMPLNRWHEAFAYRPASRQFAVVFTDITARKRTEEALRQAKDELEQRVLERTAQLAQTVTVMEQEARDRIAAEQGVKTERQRLYDLLKTLPVYVVLLSPDYRVHFANRFFEERFGKSNGRRCYELLFNLTEPCENCETMKVLKTNAPHHWQWTGPNSRDYDIYDFPFTDSDGSSLIMEMGIDVTERNMAERALRQQSEQLRTLASELTLAEQRERRRLAEVLHDDLQQLLVGAKFLMFSLGRSPNEAVKKAAAEVLELIDQSIECSHSLTSELSPPILHQGGLVPALEWLAVWMQQKHGLNVILQTQGSTAPESEDIRVLLFQSVRELLFNASKHAGVKTVEVCLRKTDDHVEMTVSDKGAGFDPEATIPREGQTSGFGLFSIRERLSQLGGEMEIDSAPGRGSRFTIRAPIGLPSTVRDEDAEVPGTLAGPRGSRMGPESPKAVSGLSRIRVLLVDDHVVVRQGLSHLLREEPDIEIVGEASDGQTAIEMVSQFLPDVVTIDISMPGMDGIQATKTIHAEFPDVKVIGLSMFDEGQRGQAMLDAGAATYLAKNGPSEALVAAIRACARRVGRRES